MSSRASRNRRKLNSDNDSLKIYGYDEAAVTGPVPYDDLYDFSKNGIHYILNALDFYDENYFLYDRENGVYDTEKIWKDM